MLVNNSLPLFTGSHGAGDDHETKTPYVIWGSGVSNPGEFKLDPETKGMSMENRLDINQVDLAPLMSTVLSIPVPVNSKVSFSRLQKWFWL